MTDLLRGSKYQIKKLILILSLFLVSGCASNEVGQAESPSAKIYVPKGDLFIQPQFESVSEFGDGMAQYSTRPSDAPLFTGGGATGKPLTFNFTDNLSGFLSAEGKILPPIYTAAYEFSNGVSAVAQEKNKFGVINKFGNWIIQPEYNFINKFNYGLAAFQKNENGKYGYLNLKGEIVIEPKFDSAGWFYEERALVCEILKNYDDSTCGFINLKGDSLTESVYSQYHSRGFSEGLAMVCSGRSKDLLCGYLDKNGKLVRGLSAEIYQSKYGEYSSMLGDFSQGLARFGGNWFDGDIQKWGFLNAEFELQIPQILTRTLGEFQSDPDDFTGELQWHTVGTSKDSLGQSAAMNKRGEIQFFSTYEEVSRFSQGLSAVKVKNKWGFINEKNEMVIEPYYDEARNFSEGFAAVRLDKKWGFVR